MVVTVFGVLSSLFRKSRQPIRIILVFLLSSMAAYFMDSYNIVIDEHMIDNILKTDYHEFFDLVNGKSFAYLFFRNTTLYIVE